MKFTVIIEDWQRGDSSSQLLDPDTGKLCCLGFASRDCGIPDEQMLNIGDPEMMSEGLKGDIIGVLLDDFRRNNLFTCLAIGVNDDMRINDEERISQLKALAIDHGHEFEFVHKI